MISMCMTGPWMSRRDFARQRRCFLLRVAQVSCSSHSLFRKFPRPNPGTSPIKLRTNPSKLPPPPDPPQEAFYHDSLVAFDGSVLGLVDLSPTVAEEIEFLFCPPDAGFRRYRRLLLLIVSRLIHKDERHCRAGRPEGSPHGRRWIRTPIA